jgi:hypothetical protein
LLPFKVHQLQLGGRHYLLLPKLNTMQAEILESRLVKSGFSVERGEVLTARSRQGAIHVAKSGLCWSSLDPSDWVLPAIPDLLASPKERTSLASLRSLYLSLPRSGASKAIRLFTRVECGPLWLKMRASDGCGLAPDEHAVATFLFNRTDRRCALLTDFFVDGATPRICGRRRYFDSDLKSDEAVATLRVVGRRGIRNSYVNKEGTFRLAGLRAVRQLDWESLFEELGEWCFFTAS